MGRWLEVGLCVFAHMAAIVASRLLEPYLFTISTG
jgi:hypothetical protein